MVEVHVISVGPFGGGTGHKCWVIWWREKKFTEFSLKSFGIFKAKSFVLCFLFDLYSDWMKHNLRGLVPLSLRTQEYFVLDKCCFFFCTKLNDPH